VGWFFVLQNHFLCYNKHKDLERIFYATTATGGGSKATNKAAACETAVGGKTNKFKEPIYRAEACYASGVGNACNAASRTS
jgi:hypothetical protein